MASRGTKNREDETSYAAFPLEEVSWFSFSKAKTTYRTAHIKNLHLFIKPTSLLLKNTKTCPELLNFANHPSAAASFPSTA